MTYRFGGLVVAALAGVLAASDASAETLASTASGNYGTSTWGTFNLYTGRPNETNELRGYTVFEVPAGAPIASAVLRMNSNNTWGPATPVLINQVTTDPALVAAGGMPRSPIFDDLGDGAAYGSFLATANNQVLEATLNAAGVTAINAARGGRIAMGFRKTNFTAVLEYIFAGGAGATPNELVITRFAIPIISGVSPASGLPSGSAGVVITGANFNGATAVSFGGAAASFVIDSATQITATAPPHAAATVDIVVTGPAGSNANTAADNYTYAVPIPVPTLSEWATILLGLTLAAGAALHIQRCRTTA